MSLSFFSMLFIITYVLHSLFFRRFLIFRSMTAVSILLFNAFRKMIYSVALQTRFQTNLHKCYITQSDHYNFDLFPLKIYFIVFSFENLFDFKLNFFMSQMHGSFTGLFVCSLACLLFVFILPMKLFY